MAESQKDINIVANVGGALTHFNGITDSGATLTRYDTTPIGGPPAADVDTDVREPLKYSVTTRVVGADQTERDSFMARFARGQTFDAVGSSPTGTGQMLITGPNATDATGRRFTVMNSSASTQQGQNMELTIEMEETGATPES
jgi:hypothetical protein